MDIPADALGFAVVIATLLGTAFGVKLLVWGRDPIRRLRGASTITSDDRLAELEERVQQLSDLVSDQAQMLEDYHERLDFAERVLARQRGDGRKAMEPPAAEGS